MTVAGTDLVEVHLLGVPLDVHVRSEEHMEELRREFALLALRPSEGPAHELPARLLRLIDELTEEYASFGAATDQLRDDAIAGGEQRIDLVYRIPAAVRDACLHLGAILAEADEYCRRGQHLLTLETAPEARRYREWFLGQFVDQIDGRPPVAWEDWTG